MGSRTARDRLNFQLVEQLYITATLLKKSGDRRIFGQFGLTTSLFAILTKIASGKDTSSELQEYIEGTPASITQKLRQLEKRGFITRRSDEADRRRWFFEITDHGWQVLARLQGVYQAQLAELFAGLDQKSKQNLLDALAELGTRLK
jgi:MarR family 2-MHQ and catechol resistance regulon transcriptional repressor